MEMDVARRLAFVGFDDTDRARVSSVTRIVDEHASSLSELFFTYLEKFPEAAGLRRGDDKKLELRRLKVEHLKAMTRGTYDDRYVEERVRLATMYAKAGLDVRLFLGAFHHLMAAVGRVIVDAFPADGFARFLSLKKIAFFDIGVMVDVIIDERERVITQQREAIRDLSTPVLVIEDRLLLSPIVGVIDSQRAHQLADSMLKAIRLHRAKAVVIDVTGVPLMDSQVANHLMKTANAARLMGARAIIAGISTESSIALVSVGVDGDTLDTAGDLRSALTMARSFAA